MDSRSVAMGLVGLIGGFATSALLQIHDKMNGIDSPLVKTPSTGDSDSLSEQKTRVRYYCVRWIARFV